MVNEAVIIVPHQLFEHNPSIAQGRKAWSVEDDRFFHDVRSQQKKLVSIGLKTSCPG